MSCVRFTDRTNRVWLFSFCIISCAPLCPSTATMWSPSTSGFS